MLSVIAIFLSVVHFSTAVLGHGLVRFVLFDGVSYKGWPAKKPLTNPPQERIVRAMQTNGPIKDVYSLPIACNGMNAPAALVANISSGANVKIQWDSWPSNHKGPITNYLASCEGDCTTFNATDGKWFKVNESGYDNSTGKWATEKLIESNQSYTFTLPKNIPAGQYLLRHEILALHNTRHPQYYPSCTQINILKGSGGLPSGQYLTKFPGAYNTSDPGYSFNVYQPSIPFYPIEGPPISPKFLTTQTTTAPGSVCSHNRGKHAVNWRRKRATAHLQGNARNLLDGLASKS
ncbi:glycosyl hydrolase family 61-domain-containing protein [Cantharellus anzutake]|uniref:glycosyl hydrolase family 61-domain-containing protein n=1 Tax=Cantharellus anzutake TaxID=1750568 RepID=UPI00190458DE|nr:glycosyl hydrolase family 61-domain-containing protein [Cantharellus anzutake]KAF8335913.1 glycosyl hydrolase family 61-domain-containing protein [Cantharellus anzutake]